MASATPVLGPEFATVSSGLSQGQAWWVSHSTDGGRGQRGWSAQGTGLPNLKELASGDHCYIGKE
jgi:hypothetical protein